MRNRAQPFLRVELPPGAAIVSAEVEGQASKPAQGSDGTRIPLLRPGFRPTGPYKPCRSSMSRTATPFGKKGRAELSLPKMDVPVSLVEWEMFLPDRYRVRRFDGDALPVRTCRSSVMSTGAGGETGRYRHSPRGASRPGPRSVASRRVGCRAEQWHRTGPGRHRPARPAHGPGRRRERRGTAGRRCGSFAGRRDQRGRADAAGWFLISGAPAGRVTIPASLQGFQESTTELNLDASNARRVDFTLATAGSAVKA